MICVFFTRLIMSESIILYNHSFINEIINTLNLKNKYIVKIFTLVLLLLLIKLLIPLNPSLSIFGNHG